MNYSPWTPPTVAQFKDQFFRDFPYAPASAADDLCFVTDKDIQNAINFANIDFNDSLFGVNATLIFLYLAAHTLVENLRTSSAGLGSIAKFALQSSAVGGVSQTNSIPSILANDPNYSKYLTTNYGKEYLNLVYPYTVGAGIGIVRGTTTSA